MYSPFLLDYIRAVFACSVIDILPANFMYILSYVIKTSGWIRIVSAIQDNHIKMKFQYFLSVKWTKWEKIV